MCQKAILTMNASFALVLVAFVMVKGSSGESLAGTRARYWRNFRNDFPKSYGTSLEEQKREKQFWQSLKTISYHNYEFRRGRATFKMGINQFSDMPFTEFAEMYTLNDSLREIYKEKTKDLKFRPVSIFDPTKFVGADLPASFDWRDRGAVTRVKDQKFCGSCYAVSAIAAIESRWFIKRGELVDLSVQEIVDCPEESYLTFKCTGGTTFKVFEYVKDNGISLDASYPYEGVVGQCRKVEKRLQDEIVGYGYVAAEDEDLALEKALVKVGPIAVAVDIKYESFMRYSSGIYYEKDCTDEINHGVLLVGYGSEGGQDFWIIKNSFGTKWGENGYFRLARNRGNHCGVLTVPLYPVIKKKRRIYTKHDISRSSSMENLV